MLQIANHYHCDDRKKEFFVTGTTGSLYKTCDWVKKSPTHRCQRFPEAAEYCPKSCGACSQIAALTSSPSPGPVKVTSSPTASPTYVPTTAPTLTPTVAATTANSNSFRVPTHSPTKHSSDAPSQYPTRVPTKLPTRVPTGSPSQAPSSTPSSYPSVRASEIPSIVSSTNPSDIPSVSPSEMPSHCHKHKGPPHVHNWEPTAPPSDSANTGSSTITIIIINFRKLLSRALGNETIGDD